MALAASQDRLPGEAVQDDRGPATPNALVADRLRQAADILAAQGADPFRVAAYRRAADAVSALSDDLGAIVERGGRQALEHIPGIGVSIAGAIAEMLTTGRWSFLDHLRGSADPEHLFCSVPGIGTTLARRIADKLHIRTLEALEAAAHDGRLESVSGLGHRRAAMVRTALAEMLGRVRRRAAMGEEPPVALLLDVDREYRERAVANDLPKIAPKRFNPGGAAWLPVLHTVRDGWHLTAIFSNTARAHQLDRTRDWVVIYFHRDGHPEGQRTVVSERHGGQTGRRVVRGREAEGLPQSMEG